MRNVNVMLPLNLPFLVTAVVRSAFYLFSIFGLVSAPILSGFNFKNINYVS